MIGRLIMGCISVVRALLGPQGVCRYTITCTQYAEQQLKDMPLYKAIPNIIHRVLSCNPLPQIFFRDKK